MAFIRENSFIQPDGGQPNNNEEGHGIIYEDLADDFEELNLDSKGLVGKGGNEAK